MSVEWTTGQLNWFTSQIFNVPLRNIYYFFYIKYFCCSVILNVIVVFRMYGSEKKRGATRLGMKIILPSVPHTRTVIKYYVLFRSCRDLRLLRRIFFYVNKLELLSTNREGDSYFCTLHSKVNIFFYNSNGTE